MDYYISSDSLMINLTNAICIYIVFAPACADCQMLGMYKLSQKQDLYISAI